MAEPNRLKWVGIRPVDPAEDIPVTMDGEEIALGMSSGAAIFASQGTKEGAALTFYTVGAGKTAYITSLNMGGTNNSFERANVRIYLYDDGSSLIDEVLFMSLMPGQARDVVSNPTPPLILPEGYYFRISSSQNGCLGYASIFGYEV
jgi:hypothetical protein